MKSNMGLIDRVLRLVIAVGIAILFYTGVISGTIGYLLVILAVVLLGTAIVGTCPLYMLFGLHTNTNKD